MILTQEKESGFLLLIGLILAFLMINYDIKFGLIFNMLLIFDLLFIVFYEKYNFSTFGTKPEYGSAIIFGTITYALFLIVTSFVGNIISPGHFGVTSLGIKELFSFLSTQVPALTSVFWISMLSYGVLVPVVETDLFFGRIFNWLASRQNVTLNFNMTNTRLWAVIIAISSIFTVYHWAVKQATETLQIGLVVVFIFSIFSCWITVYKKRTLEAIIFHIIANSLAVAVFFGVI